MILSKYPSHTRKFSSSENIFIVQPPTSNEQRETGKYASEKTYLLWTSSIITFSIRSFLPCASAQSKLGSWRWSVAQHGWDTRATAAPLIHLGLPGTSNGRYSFRKYGKQRHQNTINNMRNPYSSDLHIILVKYLNFQPPISKDNLFEEQH